MERRYLSTSSASTCSSGPTPLGPRTCSSFSEGHQSHDSQWLLHTSNGGTDVICFACAVETLEDHSTLNVKKRKMLTELIDVMSTNKLVWTLLARNGHILVHTGKVLLKLLDTTDENLSRLLVEGLGILVQKSKAEDMEIAILDSLVDYFKVTSRKQDVSMAHVCLLGKLLRISPNCLQIFLQRYQKILELVSRNAAKVDEDTAISYWYILVEVYKIDELSEYVPVKISKIVVENLIESLIKGSLKELQINLLAVLKQFTSNSLLKELLCEYEISDTTCPGKSLTDVVKKLLLSSSEEIQIGTVQCLINLTENHNTAKKNETNVTEVVGNLIDKGICEFIFELLGSSNDTLLTSVLLCLVKITEYPKFYASGHLVYGFDPVVSVLSTAVTSSKKVIVYYGLTLVNSIISGSKGNICEQKNKTEELLQILYKTTSILDIRIQLKLVSCTDALLGKTGVADQLGMMTHFLSGFLNEFGQILLKDAKVQGGKKQGQAPRLELLSIVLSLVKKSCNLVQSNLKIQGLREGEYDGVSTESGNLQLMLIHYLEYLYCLVDAYYIPSVMLWYSNITDFTIFVKIFDIMTVLLEMSSENSLAFAKKLSESSFIRIASELKSRSKGVEVYDSLVNCLNRFLIALCCHFEEEHYKVALRDTFREHLPALSSSPSDWHLYFLKDISNCSLSDEKVVASCQTVCLSLVYYSIKFGDVIVNPDCLYRSLTKFLLGGTDISALSDTSKKHLLYLWSECRLQSVKQPAGNKFVAEADKQLVDIILKSEDPLSFYSHEKCVLSWTSNSSLPSDMKLSFLRQFFVCCARTTNTSLPNSEKGLTLAYFKEFLVGISYDTDLLISSVKLLASEPKETSEVILKMMLLLLEEKETKAEYHLVKEFIHKILLSQTSHIPSFNLSSVLKLLRSLCISDFASISDLDLKFLCRVCTILVEYPYFEVQLEIMNYLNYAVTRARMEANTKLLSILCENSSFWNCFRKHLLDETKFNSFTDSLVERTCAAGLIFVSELAYSVKMMHMITSLRVKVNKTAVLLGLGLYDSSIIQLACLRFWSRYCLMKGDGILDLSACDNVSMPFSVKDVKLLLIYVQNLLLNQHNLIKDAATQCLDAILENVHSYASTAAQPWNLFILKHIEECVNLETDICCFLKVFNVFGKNKALQHFSAIGLKVLSKILRTQNQGNVDTSTEKALLKALIYLLNEHSIQISKEVGDAFHIFLRKQEDELFKKSLQSLNSDDKHLLLVNADNVLLPWDKEENESEAELLGKIKLCKGIILENLNRSCSQ